MRDQTSFAIIGAGFSGLGMALQLKRAGYQAITIFDKADRVGGVWHWNTYPGCSCDVQAHLYSYSFFPNPNWSRAFVGSAEIQSYLERLCDSAQLRGSLRLSTQVRQAVWDEARAKWDLTLADGARHEADILIGALGQLDQPALPDIPDRDCFAGPSFHSARWNHDVDLAGRRVGVIGSAASAVQLIPEIARQASSLTVFQRSANYILPRKDRTFSALEKRLLQAQPWLMDAKRAQIYWTSEILFWGLFKGDPLRVKLVEEAWRNHLTEQVKDPDLKARLTPDYPIGCKRILFCDDYYPALQRSNVSLVTQPIARIRPDGVETADTHLHGLDALIFATGFHASQFNWTLEIYGEGGGRLKDAWRDGPEAYLGVAAAGFPNFFMLYGPNTNLGHTSILTMVEPQIDYVLALLKERELRGAAKLGVTPEAQARYNRVLQGELKQLPWAGGCASWYKTETGKITNNWPRSTQDYRRLMRRPNWAHYRFSRLAQQGG